MDEEKTDRELLAAYVAQRSEVAFRELVVRYVDVVYAASLRQVTDPATAEDVTQAVFIVLMRRAGRIRDGRLLAAWLSHVTRCCAANAIRSATRRRKHEQRVAVMTETVTRGDSGEEESREREDIVLHLDALLGELGTTDRTAIVLRYFRGQPLANVGVALGVSEESAKKRVSRAVEKLRKLFLRKGITLPSAVIATAIGREATAAPAGFAEKVCSTIVMKGVAVSAAGVIAKGAVNIMAWTTAKVVGIAAVTVLLLSVGTMEMVKWVAAQRHDAPNAAVQGSEETIRVHVKEMATGKPIAGVQVRMRSDQDFDARSMTDDAGDAVISVGASGKDQVQLNVSGTGWAPLVSRWVQSPTEGKIPAEFDFALEKGTTIGGQVVDQDRNPVSGAQLMVSAKKNYPGLPQTLTISDVRLAADAQGRWEYTGLPAQVDGVALAAFQPEFLGESGAFELADYKDIAALYGRTAAITLTRRVALEGVVRGPDGAGVASAKVSYGDDLNFSNRLPPVHVKEDGSFKLGVPENSEATLTVNAPGYAIELKRVKAGHDPVKVAIDLEPPQQLTGSVVDKDGNPVDGAYIFFDTWRGVRTLNHREVADAGGRFLWNEAPADEMTVSASAPGYKTSDKVTVQAGKENVIRLLPETIFQGKVIDAATGAPVKVFHVMDGPSFGPGFAMEWNGAFPRPVRPGNTDGEFTTTFNESYPAMVVRVQADGYEAADSPRLVLEGQPLAYTFKLVKGTNTAGKLVDLDGNPVKGATVYLAEDGTQVNILENNELEDADRAQYLKMVTDDNGRFSFVSQKSEYMLIVARNEGTALARRTDFEKTHTLAIVPWARVEGDARVGTHPAAGMLVFGGSAALDKNDTNSDVGASRQVKVDAAGKFIIEHLLPGRDSIELMVQVGNREYPSGQPLEVELKAGETAHVLLGGKGMPVAGKIVSLPDAPAKGKIV